jgi:prevent-host-death family protein
MTKAIPAVQARQQFGTLLNEVDLKGSQIVIERDGKPMAVMIPYRQFESWFQKREKSFERLEEAAKAVAGRLEQKGKTQQDLLALIDEAVVQTRSKTKKSRRT